MKVSVIKGYKQKTLRFAMTDYVMKKLGFEKGCRVDIGKSAKIIDGNVWVRIFQSDAGYKISQHPVYTHNNYLSFPLDCTPLGDIDLFRAVPSETLHSQTNGSGFYVRIPGKSERDYKPRKAVRRKTVEHPVEAVASDRIINPPLKLVTNTVEKELAMLRLEVRDLIAHQHAPKPGFLKRLFGG